MSDKMTTEDAHRIKDAVLGTDLLLPTVNIGVETRHGRPAVVIGFAAPRLFRVLTDMFDTHKLTISQRKGETVIT